MKCIISSHACLMGFRFRQVADFEATKVMRKMTKPGTWLMPEVMLDAHGALTAWSLGHTVHMQNALTSHASTNRQMLLLHEEGEGDLMLNPEMAKLGGNPCGPTPHLSLCTHPLSCRCGTWWSRGGNVLLRVWCSHPFILETSWNGDLYADLLVGLLSDNCRWCFYLSVTCVPITFDRHL